MWLACVVCGVIISVVSSPGFRSWLRDQRTRRALQSVPITAIAALESGPGRVRGRIVPLGEPLISPLSGKRCVLFEIRVERYTRGWREICSVTVAQDFAISDGSGLLSVVSMPSTPTGRKLSRRVHVRSDRAHFHGPTTDCPIEIEQLCGRDLSPLIFSQKFRFREALAVEDQEVDLLAETHIEVSPERRVERKVMMTEGLPGRIYMDLSPAPHRG